MLLSCTLRGFHFSLHCYVLRAASEVVKGHLDLPSPLAGRQEALYRWCIWISLFSAVVSLLFLCTFPACPGPAVFRESPAMRPAPQCNTSGARGPWGELRCVCSSEQVAGAASGWALLLLGTPAVRFKPYTCTLQQRKPTLYYLQLQDALPDAPCALAARKTLITLFLRESTTEWLCLFFCPRLTC